jgi:CPA2 family monovalent cation:H+ antiporter-2
MSSEATSIHRPFLRNGPAVIAGFGVPGRAVAEWMAARQIPYLVIEQNNQIVNRCSLTGTPIIVGDTREEAVLRRAGIENAGIFAVTVPVEAVVLDAVAIARRLNPRLHIIARCTYISGGLEAHRLGANETIVAEEIAAHEFVRRLDSSGPLSP